MKTEVALGIDVGGTNTAFGFVDINGKCIADSSIPTKANNSAADLFARLNSEVDKLYNTISENCVLKGVGIGAPNANYYRGTVENPPNLRGELLMLLKL